MTRRWRRLIQGSSVNELEALIDAEEGLVNTQVCPTVKFEDVTLGLVAFRIKGPRFPFPSLFSFKLNALQGHEWSYGTAHCLLQRTCQSSGSVDWSESRFGAGG